MADPHRIILQPEAFGAGFDVLVAPKPAGLELCCEFKSYREARGYAAGIAAALGWPITDTTERADHVD